MLTARYETLRLQRGESLLDMGCGFGRHAYAAARLGAKVVALDAGADEVVGVMNTATAMIEAGELPLGAPIDAVRGDAFALPFADGTFDRIIASEILEHLPTDTVAMDELARVLKPGGTIAITVPRFGPELINWALSDEYHGVEGGHVRIYRRSVLLERLTGTGLRPYASHHAHALHAPYWWLKCAVGTTNDEHKAVKAYHKLLVWDIMKGPKLTRYAERVLNPLIGKSVIIYLEKPLSALTKSNRAEMSHS